MPLGLLAGYLGGWIDAMLIAHHRRHAGDPVPDPGDRAGGVPRPSLGNAMIAIGVAATPIFVRLTAGR